jgi:hypothetical protein
MKKKLALLALVLTTMLTAVGCSSAWWQNFKSDPVAQIQLFENTEQTALSDADVIWQSIRMYLPPDIQAKAQLRYDQAVFAVNKAMALLNDGVQVAIQAQTANPDFSKLIQAVSDAVAQVVAIINEFKNAPPPPQLALGVPPKPAAIAGLDDLSAAVTTMNKIGGVNTTTVASASASAK